MIGNVRTCRGGCQCAISEAWAFQFMIGCLCCGIRHLCGTDFAAFIYLSQYQLPVLGNLGKGGEICVNSQRRAKVATVEELKEKFSSSRSVIFADYKGLNVERISLLRRRCREAGVEMRVSKNTLTRIAVREIGLPDAVQYLVDSTACFYGINDPVAPAKIVDTFSKEYRLNLAFRGGVVEGKVVGPAEVANLVNLPPKEVLLAQVLGTINAPLVGLLNVMQGNARSLVYALESLRKLKAGE